MLYKYIMQHKKEYPIIQSVSNISFTIKKSTVPENIIDQAEYNFTNK